MSIHDVYVLFFNIPGRDHFKIFRCAGEAIKALKASKEELICSGAHLDCEDEFSIEFNDGDITCYIQSMPVL
ncbi:hypothetical protein [Listeria booriae]|uniref:Uncharacterized protein n=1 Tax=Listeria booriae TaxID=1552123 RepID=A0A7X0WGP3_9LIST|nr:hypothetical protein [Listeria booriae]MBC1318504.1 hypothetical protein [Listeria booriae]MBC1333524.1 hypothetical protein [Listeria booriae]MBC2388813.1 hypothetical protein [Listeria booriae]